MENLTEVKGIQKIKILMRNKYFTFTIIVIIKVYRVKLSFYFWSFLKIINRYFIFSCLRIKINKMNFIRFEFTPDNYRHLSYSNDALLTFFLCAHCFLANIAFYNFMSLVDGSDHFLFLFVVVLLSIVANPSLYD